MFQLVLGFVGSVYVKGDKYSDLRDQVLRYNNQPELDGSPVPSRSY